MSYLRYLYLFGWSLPPVVCRMAHVLFTLSVFVYVIGVHHILCCVFVFLRLVYLYVASFSGFSFLIAPSVFSNIYLSCVLCTLCCQFLWIFLFDCPFGIL
jgi:hypothetical protein